LADGYFVMQQLSLHLLEEDLIEINSTQSLFANNRKCRKTQQYNTKWQVAREA